MKQPEMWRELRPYKTDDDMGEVNMHVAMDHLERFLAVVARDGHGKVRLFLRVPEQSAAVLETLDGIESVMSEPFDFAAYGRYREYRMARHCASQVRVTERMSAYRTLDVQVAGPSFLAVRARRINTAVPINEYIRLMERGVNPEGFMRFFSAGSREYRPTYAARTKIKDAQDKISTGTLFLCRLFAGADTLEDVRSIGASLPASSFAEHARKARDMRQITRGPVTLPTFGAHKSVVLSNAEMLSILTMPTIHDIDSVNFEFGKVDSKAAGLRDGAID